MTRDYFKILGSRIIVKVVLPMLVYRRVCDY